MMRFTDLPLTQFTVGTGLTQFGELLRQESPLDKYIDWLTDIIRFYVLKVLGLRSRMKSYGRRPQGSVGLYTEICVKSRGREFWVWAVAPTSFQHLRYQR